MQKNLKNLLKILQPKQISANQYQADSLYLGLHRVFGGQLLAQASYVALHQLSDKNKQLSSNFANFLHPVNVNLPIIYQSTTLKQTNKFEIHRIDAYQQNSLMFTSSFSFHIKEQGLEHEVIKFDLAVQKDLIDEDEAIEQQEGKLPPQIFMAIKHFREMFPFEIKTKYINNPFQGEKFPAEQCIYIKADNLSKDDFTHELFLNYLSDYGFLPTALHPHNIGFMQKGLIIATLNHAQWFHREIDLNQGILFFMESPILENNRGLVNGQIIDLNGNLISSATQEGLIRYKNIMVD